MRCLVLRSYHVPSPADGTIDAGLHREGAVDEETKEANALLHDKTAMRNDASKEIELICTLCRIPCDFEVISL